MEHNSYTVMLAKIRAHRATREVIAKALSDYDVTLMQWLFIGAVEKEGGDTTAKKMAVELSVTMPLVTRFSKQLNTKNLILITPQETDKRIKHISLTPKGTRLLEMTEPVVRNALGEWLSAIPREDVQTYITVLLQVAYKI